jgi:hypothetical protein
MSAANVVMQARSVGIQIAVEGDDLVLEAKVPPPTAALKLLSQNKSAIMLWLRPLEDGWSPEDWQSFFDECISNIELDEKLSRGQAEDRAFNCCVIEWLTHYPLTSSSDYCFACGVGDTGNTPLLPYGAESIGHVWLHSLCWQGWFEGRKAKAIAALTAMKIIVTIDVPGDTENNENI